MIAGPERDHAPYLPLAGVGVQAAEGGPCRARSTHAVHTSAQGSQSSGQLAWWVFVLSTMSVSHALKPHGWASQPLVTQLI
eukprot:scaffold12688_cov146-Isochrysis_galbana.AAC.5